MSDTPAPFWLRAAPFLFLLFWSSGYPLSKLGMRYASPFGFMEVRYALVLAIIIPLFLWLRPPLPKRRTDYLHIGVTGFLIQTVYFAGCYMAFAVHTSSGLVALICSLQPLLVAALAPLLVGERTSALGWTGLALGFCGAAITIAGYEHAQHFPILGVFSAIAALCGMTGGTLYEKRFGTTQHPVTANLVQYVVAFLTTTPFAFMQFHVEPNLHFIIIVSYLVVANSLISISLFLAMVRYGRAAQASALFYLVPPLAAIMAWFVLGEPVPKPALIGMAVAGLGVALVRWQKAPS